MKAVIIAGGRGTRLEKATEKKNKCMLEIYGKTILEYNLDRAAEAGVKEIILVLYYEYKEIIRHIGKEYRGIKVRYVIEKKGEGIVAAIGNAREAIGESDFILMLGDEILINADMKGMLRKFRDEELLAVCGVVYEQDKSSIKKTYAVMANERENVLRLVEKPRFPSNNLKGTGHCIFKNEILDYIERTPINMYRNQKELVDMIQVAIDDGKKVKIYKIAESYANVNTIEDLNITKEAIKKSNPRVLIVHNQMKYYGGAELLIAELANWLTKRGIKNDILALSVSKEVQDKLINTEVIIPEHDVDLSPPGYKNMQDILKAIKAFRKKLREIAKNYDVINFHDFPTTWTLWPKKKAAVWFMNLPPNLYSKPGAGFILKTLNRIRIWFDRFLVRSSMDIITVAEEANLARAMQRYSKAARLIHFGINYDFFSKGNAKKADKKFNLENKFVLVHSGILCNAKNQMASLEAVARVKDKIPNILLILTGKEDIEYRKKLDEFVRKNKLEKNVLFAGYLPTREELVDLYSAADIGMFPIGKQGGVLAPFEALCSEIPIIASEEMETASFIRKNNLGIVTQNYPKAILEIYNNQEKYRQEAKQAAKFIRENLSWRMFADKMIIAYKDAWKRHK